MVDTVAKVWLPRSCWEQMRQHAERAAPEEACGLIAGTIIAGEYQAITVFPLTNALHSGTRFKIDPQEQVETFQIIESKGWALVGIYHSHPDGPETPSPTDIAEAYYPEVAYLIWARTSKGWKCHSFSIQSGTVSEVDLMVID